MTTEAERFVRRVVSWFKAIGDALIASAARREAREAWLDIESAWRFDRRGE